MRRLLLSFVALSVLIGAVHGLAQPGGPEPWIGRFRLRDPAAADRAVATAIDQAIAGLAPSMRDVFRSGLRASLGVPRSLSVQREAGDIVVTRDGRGVRAPIGGAERAQTGPEGHAIRVRHRLAGGHFVEERRSSQGQRIDTFRAQGGELLVATEFRSPLLRSPVRFEVAYARQEPADGGVDEPAVLSSDAGALEAAGFADAGGRGRRPRPDGGAARRRVRDAGAPRGDTPSAPR